MISSTATMNNQLGVWQNALRKQLEMYVNGAFLRKRARILAPLRWEVAPEQIRESLEDFYEASLSLRSFAERSDVSSFLDYLDKLSKMGSDITEREYLDLITSAYRLFTGLIQCDRIRQVKENHVLNLTDMETSTCVSNGRYLEPVKQLASFVRDNMTPYLCAGFIHGSVADCGFIQGFSDLDTLLILNKETVFDPEKLRQFAKLCYQSTAYLYWFDPTQHHGHMAWTDIDLDFFPETWLPVSVLDASKSIVHTDRAITIYIRESNQEAREVFEQTVDALQVMYNAKWRPANAYDFKYMLSVLMLMPARYLQAQGVLCSKKESFVVAQEQLDSDLWEAIEYATKCRSRWPYVRSSFARAVQHLPVGCNEYLIRIVQRHNLAANETKSISLFKPDLLKLSANLAMKMWQTLELSKDKKLKISASNLPLAINKPPARRQFEEYDTARSAYLELLKKLPNLSSIIEFGSVGKPGLSDLDFVISVKDDLLHANPGNFSINSLPYRNRSLILHEPIIVPDAMTQYLAEFLPVSDLRVLWKSRDIDLSIWELNSEELSWSAAARLIEKLHSYKVWFAINDAQPQLDARWAIAILKSILYSQELMQLLGCAENITSKQYSQSVKNVRDSWFRERSVYVRNESLRSLYQLGRKQVDAMTTELDIMLRSKGWISSVQLREPDRRPHYLTSERICVLFEDDNREQEALDYQSLPDNVGLVRVPNSFLRTFMIYSQEEALRTILYFTPAKSDLLLQEKEMSDFENYLAKRARLLAIQAEFLGKLGTGFGSLMPSGWVSP